MAVGIVVVSHSRALAEAAVDLAAQMVHGDAPSLAIAAGLPDGTFGTDATAVMAALAEVDQGDGVAVFVDMGSAVMSAEMGIELYGESASIRVLNAPFVEGLVAGVVRAAMGSSLDEVAAEAEAALRPKQAALGGPEASQPPPPTVTDALTSDVVIADPHGLHARPAARLAQLARSFDAEVLVSTATRGPVAASSTVGLATLTARQGETVHLSASGPQAAEALRAVAEALATEN